MMKKLDKLATVIAPSNSIDQVIRRMAEESGQVKHPGLAVVLDEKGKLLGIMTDGDIRRAYARNINFSEPVSEVMTIDPITIPATIPEVDIAAEVIRLVQLEGRLHSDWVRHVPLVDERGRLVKIIDFLEALQAQNGSVKKVAIFGMGHVGLTLAVSLANRGHQVIGVDINQKLIQRLNLGTSHVFEPGLEDMLAINLEREKINFLSSLSNQTCQIYIIAVGTPLDSKGNPNLKALNEVLKTISVKLKHGDHVILRSTVPVGTTREIVVPYLESKTKLKAGEDFFITFSPERTIEGNAMYELKNLPQVIGGYSGRCLKDGAEFWSTLTSSIVRMASLEASEMVKLANNTFRDISFAFANELALMADKYNVDAFALIHGANDGYPRNPISLPSPGVGGYCLTKDPILFSSTPNGSRPDAMLGLSSRTVNMRAALYPVELVERYAKRFGIPLCSMKIVIMGVAFKGVPATIDMRDSVAVGLLNVLKKRVSKVIGWDAAIEQTELKRVGFETTNDLRSTIEASDVVLILNNHPENVRSELYCQPPKQRLLFDGWNQLDVVEVEKISGLNYATMGYMTQ
jgi:UDP-N-acetyl-D-mannosaminuronic acid dehydrogenase